LISLNPGGLARGPPVVGEGVADRHVGHLLDARDHEADLAADSESTGTGFGVKTPSCSTSYAPRWP